jgi:hypothetical protein
MKAASFRVFDPLAGEWATPYPAALPMTGEADTASRFDSEAAAVIHARGLIGPTRPWLVMQPVCPCCGRNLSA